MKIEVDHVYVFTSVGAPEIKALVEAGFLEGPRRVHTGQGTSNVCFFFKNLYLEFIWVHDANEAQTQPETRLLERSTWRQTGYCPFGIGFRTIPENSNLPIKTWNFTAPYLPNGASIRIVDNAEKYATEPGFFILPFSRKVSNEWQTHKNGVTEVTAIKIISPYGDKLSPQAEYFQTMGLLLFEKGDNYLMKLDFDHLKQGKTINLQAIIPLEIRY